VRAGAACVGSALALRARARISRRAVAHLARAAALACAGGDLCEDGVLGLPRAFIGAGARVVLSSLWAVPDESAKRVMIGWCARARDGALPQLEHANARAS
jgi:hypothetical protein